MKVIAKNKNAVLTAAKNLRQGKIIIFPTDTIYGILANATNKKAVKKIFKIKKRDPKKPFPILVSSFKEARRYGLIDGHTKKFWPGPFTLIFPYRGGLAPETISKDGGVALRLPKNPRILKLLKKVKKPLVATSANLSGIPYDGTPSAIISAFVKSKFKPFAFFDFGILPRRTPSTIVDLHGKKPKIIRA